MPITNKNIAIEESSTITARVATVQIPRGSTNEQQEILVLGDPLDSLGMARVVASTPASTEYGLVVREVAQSTGPFAISSIAGVSKVTPNDTSWASSAGFHFNSSGELNVNLASPSTIVSVSTVGGIVTIRPSDTNFASSAGFHFDSSGALQIKEVAAPSTGPIAISSIAGQTRVAPTDTNWASSAGFHFDSSGALQIAGTFSASTTVNVSSVSGLVAVNGSTTANSSAVVAVRMSDGTNWISVAADYIDGSTASSITGPVMLFNNGSNATLRVVSSSTPLPVNLGAAVSTVWASSAGFHFDSSGALQITGASASTQVAVSSVAGIVAVRPTDTNWASSAGFHFDSSGGLQIAGNITGSTVITISTVQGIVRVAGSSLVESSLNVSVRLSDGSTWVTLGTDYSDGSTASTVVGPAIVFDNSSNHTMRAVSTATPLPVAIIAGTAAGSTDVSIHGVTVSTFVQNSSAYVAVRLTDGSAFTNYSTIAAVSSVSGIVTVRPSDTNFASSAGFHFDSSGALQITGASASTQVAVSSVAGIVAVRPSDTNWASSAGFHFNSSGELQTVAAVTTSTTVNVSSVGGAVIVRSSAADQLVTAYQSTYTDFNGLMRLADRDQATQTAAVLNAAPASSVWALAIREVAQSTGPFAISSIAGQTRVAPTDTNWASSAGFHFNSSGELQTVAAVTTSTTVQVSSVGGIVAVRPSDTNWASSAGFHFTSSGELSVNASFSGSTDVRISGVAVSTFAQNSSAYLPIRISDGSSFLTPQDVTDGSTNSTLVGMLLGYNASSGNTMRIVGVTQPLPVQVNAQSSGFAISSVSGVVTVSTGPFAISSIAGVSVVRLTTDLQSTASPSSNSSGLVVRSVIDNLFTAVSTSAFASTTFVVSQNVAGQRCKIYGYSITSTVTSPVPIRFMGGSTLMWALTIQAASSAISGANMMVDPPAFICAGDVNSSVSIRVDSTVAGVVVSAAYFMAP